jgi:AAA domain (dynein-related subfamily)
MPVMFELLNMKNTFDIHAYISTLSKTKKSTEDAYTSSPSGDISISRLIENKSDYFIKPNPDTREVKKTIILADWSICDYREQKKDFFMELIHELKRQNFNMVILQNNGFVPLEHVSQFEDLAQNIQPLLSDDIKKQAVKKLPKPIDELHVLDFKEMCRIFHDKNPKLQNAIPISSLARISNKPKLIPLFNQYFTRLHPDSIINDEMTIPNQDHLERDMKTKFPSLHDLPFINKPDSIALRVDTSKGIPNSNLFLQTITDAMQENAHPELGNTKNLSIMNIQATHNQDKQKFKEELYEFINQLPSLERIEIENALIDGAISKMPGHIKSLQIGMQKSDLVFKNNPNLCALEIYNLSADRNKFQLEKLVCQNRSFNLADFKQLPHLTKFDFYNGNFIGELPQAMPALECLKLKKCSVQGVKQLLESQKEIKELEVSLNNSRDEQSVFSDFNTSYPLLEKCKLNDLPPNVIKNIVDNAPQLRSLKINVSSTFDGQSTPLDISNLKEFYLTSNRGDLENVDEILKNAQKLEVLELNTAWDSMINFNSQNSPFPLALLKRLKIRTDIMNLVDFQKLICNAHDLEEIDIGVYLPNENAPLVFSHTFPHLKKISLNRAKIPGTILNKILEPCSKIETLSIKSINYIFLFLLLEKNYPNLQELNIEGVCDINLLKRFLEKHPDIQKINYFPPKNNSPSNAFIDILKTFPEVNIDHVNIDDYLKDLKKHPPTTIANAPSTIANAPSTIANAPSTSANAPSTIANAPSTSANAPSTSANAPSTIPKATAARVDANTTPDPTKAFNLKEVFSALDGSSHPDATYYRLQTFDTFEFGEMGAPFILKNSNDFQWDNTKSPQKSLDNVISNCPENKSGYFYGAQKITVTTDWQPLPSLFPNEIMTHFHTKPDIQGVEIQYSKRDNLYYIKSNAPQDIDINFLIHRPQQPIHELPENIRDWVNYFNQFGEKALENPPNSPKELLGAIMTQKVGACRHRAVAFKYQMDLLKIPCRVITNDCHAYAEVQHHGQWHTCQLGGYAASLNITEAPRPPSKDKASKTPSIPAVRRVQMDYPSEEEIQYRRLFAPEKSTPPESLQAFIQGALHGKQLIHVDKEHIQPLAFAIQKQALDTQHPVFYIDSPDDLICSARVFKRQSNQQGQWQQPGGLLYEFIQENQDEYPVFIINYAKFSADDIARISNSLYDKTASADGVPLPKQSIIVGLSDPNIGYTGADFYSRFDKIIDYPKELPIPTWPIFQDQASEDCVEINLFNSPAWKTKLFGGWKIEQNVPHFIDGALKEALRANKPIKIINPPDDPDFDKIWTQARISCEIKTLDNTFIIPKDLAIFTEQQPFPISEKLHIQDTPVKNPQFLNPSRVANFFNQYTFTDGKLSQTPGIIELHQNKILNIQLTRDLTNETWNAFFAHCEKFNVKPNIMRSIDAKHIWEPSSALNNTNIVTKDIDLTLSQITDIDDWVVIDASELKACDLIQSIKGAIQGDDFVFQQRDQALIQLLNNNKKVILKGALANELIDELVPFMHQRSSSGKLLLVTESPISGLSSYEHQFQRDKNLSFIEEKTRRERGDKTYKGLDKITSKISLPPFSPDTSAIDTQDFIDARKQQVMENLKSQPYIFIAGLTGVGKSRFIESELSKDHDIFLGNIKEWAEKKPIDGKMNILFIDEANLSPQQWSEFEGLFQKKPGMVIDGQYVPLSENHKVIFAGNPLNYGDDRKIAPLFARHGNAIIFEPLSPAFIYEKVVKDILGDKPDIGEILLKYYQFVAECSEKEVLITPRQVQMIAALIKVNPDIDPNFYAQQICRPLVPENKLKSFDETFPKVEKHYKVFESPNFCNTPSRLPYQHQILDFLKLQQQGLDKGLNRLVLEGEAGIGKTEMVIDLLISQGYTKNQPGGSKTFYHIPASMNYKQKTEAFLKAFNEGAIVLIDEINSVATMEKLLNNLLDGKHPEDNRPPKNAGFRLIGTQNPPEYAGRNIDSPALASRTITIKLETYPHHEMLDILQSKGLEKEKAESLVKAFEFRRKEAIDNHEQAIPSFRDLVKKAESLIQADQKKIENDIKYTSNSNQTESLVIQQSFFKQNNHSNEKSATETEYTPQNQYYDAITQLQELFSQLKELNTNLQNKSKKNHTYHNVAKKSQDLYNTFSPVEDKISQQNIDIEDIKTDVKKSIDFIQDSDTQNTFKEHRGSALIQGIIRVIRAILGVLGMIFLLPLFLSWKTYKETFFTKPNTASYQKLIAIQVLLNTLFFNLNTEFQSQVSKIPVSVSKDECGLSAKLR